MSFKVIEIKLCLYRVKLVELAERVNACYPMIASVMQMVGALATKSGLFKFNVIKVCHRVYQYPLL